MPRKKLGDTKTEAEDARWFEENQDQILKLFEQAEKAGALRIGDKSVGITVSRGNQALARPRSQKLARRRA